MLSCWRSLEPEPAEVGVLSGDGRPVLERRECEADKGDLWLMVAVRERLRRPPAEPGRVSELLVAGEDVKRRGEGGAFLLLKEAALDRCVLEKPGALAVSTERPGEAVADELVSIESIVCCSSL